MRTGVRLGPSLFARLTLLATACGTRGAPLGVVVTDSAGVAILQNNAPQWSSGTTWELEAAPSMDIGGDSTLELFRVGALQGVRGGVAVLNAGSSEILRFDVSGRLQWRAGGPGRGPREFASLRDLYRCEGDTLVVNDFTRAMVVDPAGRFARSELLLSRLGEGGWRLRGVGGSCASVVVSTNRRPQLAIGESGRGTNTFYWADLGKGTRDSIGTFPARELVGTVVQGSLEANNVPWGATGVWTVGTGRFYHGTSDRAEVAVFDREKGLRRIIRWTETGRAITSRDRDLYAEKREWVLSLFPAVAEAVPPLDQTVVPARAPIFTSLMLDDSGDLWVRRYATFLAGRADLYGLDQPLRYTPPPGPDPETWLVFNESGRWLGQVKTPHDLSVRTISQGMVFGVWRDSLDIEHVRAYRIRKAGRTVGQ